MGVTNFVGEALRTGKSIVTGMKITFQEMMFRPAITVFYPDQRDEIPPWFRGIPVLKTDLRTGEYKCTSCLQCAQACPVNVITIEWHQDPETKKKVCDRFAIDMSRCMLCNFCVEACPFDSLVMGYDYELCKVDPENLVFEFEDLLRLGLKYSKAEDPGPKASRSATPPWVFHDLTNATEDDIQDVHGYLGRPPLPKGYEPELKPQFRKQEEAGPEAAAEAEAKAEPKPEAKAEAKPEAKPEAKAETRPASKPAAEPGSTDGEGAGQP